MLTDTHEPMLLQSNKQKRAAKLRSVEWLGQMMASLCWMTSMSFYGLNSIGDWLQLCAATAWTVANLGALLDR